MSGREATLASGGRIDRGFSCYLDLVRVGAALVVFLHHLTLDFGCYAPDAVSCPRLVPYHAGHSAVVIFFVLSGYVITYVANERERTLQAFALARIARIYSVAIPVLALVMALDGVAALHGDYGAFPLYQYQSVWKYALLALTFTTDHWFLAERAFSLTPWWSLSYEVWYYVLFAAFFFTRGVWRWVLPAVVMLVMGPKLLAMFPLWLLGSLVYFAHRTGFVRQLKWAPVLFWVTLAAMLGLALSGGTLPIDRWTDSLTSGWLAHRMRFSQWFVGDFVLGVLFAANVFAARYVALGFGWATRAIKYCAAYSFTFYMIHMPVERAFANYVDHDMLVTALATIGFTFLFGSFTERQKDNLRRGLAWAADAVSAGLKQRQLRGEAK